MGVSDILILVCESDFSLRLGLSSAIAIFLFVLLSVLVLGVIFQDPLILSNEEVLSGVRSETLDQLQIETPKIICWGVLRLGL